ncbi:SGNH/GDSL hydrolase family protein [Micrococcales bacterium 31B]|nr:SGNH/GDSL hydrolase family protein [Micrococcales bacterium 31B]
MVDAYTPEVVAKFPELAGRYRGWADLIAGEMSRRRLEAGLAPLEYASLAIRGRKLPQIVTEQVSSAMRMLHDEATKGPVLVSFMAGGNDMLRLKADVHAMAELVEDCVRRLRSTGADVLMTTHLDVSNLHMFRSKKTPVAIYTAYLNTIARRHGCFIHDLWGLTPMYDSRMWGIDRIHPSTEGHRVIAASTLAALGLEPGIPGEEPERPLPAPRVAWAHQLRRDAEWARADVGPWISRRLRGVSSGDTIPPKFAQPVVIGPDELNLDD